MTGWRLVLSRRAGQSKRVKLKIKGVIMRRLIAAVLAVSFIVLPVFLSGESRVLKVKVQVANVRIEPDINSPVVKQFSIGTLLEYQQKIGDWYEITISDDNGAVMSAFIHAMVVDVVASEQQEPQLVQDPVVREERRPPTERAPAAPPSISYASQYPRGGFKLIGGVDSANITYSPIEEFDLDQYKKSKLGVFGGIGFETGSMIGLEVNALFMQKGVKFNGRLQESGYDVTFDATTSINVISIPVMLKVRFMPGSTPYVLGGVEAAYIMSNKTNYSYTDAVTGESESGTEDSKEDTKDLDYGLVFGIGYEINTGSLPLFIEGRYHLGLADISADESDINVQDDTWVKTNALLLAAGIRF
jgi:opacity protein-like surface antigen